MAECAALITARAGGLLTYCVACPKIGYPKLRRIERSCVAINTGFKIRYLRICYLPISVCTL